MATLRGCDRTNTRNQEPLRIRQISDLIQTDMEVIPLLGLRHRNADAKSGSGESSARPSFLDSAWRRRLLQEAQRVTL